jgi:hypothetical protein
MDSAFCSWDGGKHDDDREWYKGIKIAAAADGRFYPYVPYWWHGPRTYGPSFGFARSDGSFKEAMAKCEMYLAQDENDW